LTESSLGYDRNMQGWRNLVIMAAVSVGCGGAESNDGEIGGHCYPNGTCNVGLHCVSGLCAPIDAGLPDAVPLTDAAIDALVCTDTMYEPNDTVQTAFPTGVANTQMTRTFTGLMICPAGDKDHFAITILTPNQTLEMVFDVDAAGMELAGSILNAGGTPIANASPVSSMPLRRRAYTPNLPTGTYYAVVFGAQGYTNRYQLTLTVTNP
jgi:hypothetical protein